MPYVTEKQKYYLTIKGLHLLTYNETLQTLSGKERGEVLITVI